LTHPSAISRRLEHLQAGDCEGALVDLFPAIDKTAKKRRPKAGVGARVRGFLEDEEALISAIGTGNVFRGILVNGISITDALYRFGRTSITHEGELDPRLEFNDSGKVEIGAKRWNLPSGYITGMCVAVIAAPENRSERVGDGLTVKLFDQSLRVNEIWGDRERVRRIICDAFGRSDIFE
jgi:hypothetical protein